MPKSNKPEERRLRPAPANSKRIEVIFALERAEAQEVFLSGDFNDWSPASLRMIRRGQNGRWEKRVALEAGRYEYKFVIDREWIHDPQADQNGRSAGGSLNSVMEVQL